MEYYCYNGNAYYFILILFSLFLWYPIPYSNLNLARDHSCRVITRPQCGFVVTLCLVVVLRWFSMLRLGRPSLWAGHHSGRPSLGQAITRTGRHLDRPSLGQSAFCYCNVNILVILILTNLPKTNYNSLWVRIRRTRQPSTATLRVVLIEADSGGSIAKTYR